MAYYVSKGAKLKCPMGSEQSSLEVVHLERPVLLRGEPMANIMDFKPMVNIKPFGRCCSLMNPVVAAATAANYGRLQEMPCIPNPTAPWQGGKMKLDIKGAPALLSTSKCMCMWAGAIEITHPGQNTVYEGGPMTITITDPTMETLQSLESMGGDVDTQGALGRGFQPADLLPNLSAALGAAQLPQIPNPLSFIEKIKKAVETILQKIAGVFQSGSDIRSSAVADSKNSVSQAESKKEEVKKSSKYIGDVTGANEAFNGQKITYKAIVYDKYGPVFEECYDVRWAIKVGDVCTINKEKLKDKKGKSIELEIEEEWVDKKEITVIPYLVSNPLYEKSKKTKLYKLELPVVIDRYKMPGLNQDGSDIADDMCYGNGRKSSLPIYQKAIVDKYIEEYRANGFDENKHKSFSNIGSGLKSIYDNNNVPNLVRYANEMNEFFKKAEKDTDEKLFTEFKNMATSVFALTNSLMRNNIDLMIKKFRENKGGIYDEPKLAEHIKTLKSTERYCEQLEAYIDKELKKNNGNILKMEDKRVDWNKYESASRTKKDRIKNKGKNFSLTPVYDSISFSFKKLFDGEKWENTFGGATIALNDIWATEVMITKYNLNGKKYDGKYQVTLWDHFGLDVKDIEKGKPAGNIGGFIAWFILQHFRGYKPFITKITFDKEFKGTL